MPRRHQNARASQQHTRAQVREARQRKIASRWLQAKQSSRAQMPGANGWWDFSPNEGMRINLRWPLPEPAASQLELYLEQSRLAPNQRSLRIHPEHLHGLPPQLLEALDIGLKPRGAYSSRLLYDRFKGWTEPYYSFPELLGSHRSSRRRLAREEMEQWLEVEAGPGLYLDGGRRAFERYSRRR